RLTPLTYYRPDYDTTFSLPGYDDGSYVQDGFELRSRLGSANARLFGGSFGSANAPLAPILGASSPTGLPPVVAGQQFGTGAGVGLNRGVIPGQVVGFYGGVPLFKGGELGLTLLDFSNTTGPNGGSAAAPAGGVAVYGANVKLNSLGRFQVF